MIRRLFTLQPGLVGSAAAAAYVAAAMLYHVATHTGVLAPDELVAAAAAIYGLWARTKVTPLARPRNQAGIPLVSKGPARPSSAGEHWPMPGPPRL